MTESETPRLIAWSLRLREVHTRLRHALRVTRDAVADGASDLGVTRDLLLFCHGFCAALNGHHQGEDSTLFPAIAAARPELRPVLSSLEQDHSMLAHLLGELQAALDHGAPPAEIVRHLDGVEAVMENHFGYEERQLLEVLENLELSVDPGEALGPL